MCCSSVTTGKARFCRLAVVSFLLNHQPARGRACSKTPLTLGPITLLVTAPLMLCMAVTGKPMFHTNTGIPRQLQQNSLMSSTLVTSALICELRRRKKSCWQTHRWDSGGRASRKKMTEWVTSLALACESIFTGPRCLWGPVYGSRCLYLCHSGSFVKLCWCWWWYQLNTIHDANLKRSLAICN